MKVAIIEDEKLAASRLLRILKETAPEAEVIFIADTVRKAVQFFSSSPEIDLAFFDIELADGQSFDIFSLTEVKCPVIFTTAYDEYALRAFKVNSIDYLLKPVSETEVKGALDKFRRQNSDTSRSSIDKLIEELKLQAGENYKTRFLSRQGTKMISIHENDISFFYAEDKVTFIMTVTGDRFIINNTLDEIEKSVNPAVFFRIHRGMIIHTSSIKEVNAWVYGKIKLKVQPVFDDEVYVSRDRAPLFRKWIGE